MTDAIRLQKYLSMAGVASRREAERMLLDGRVRVDGEVVRTLGTRVVPGTQRVELDGRLVSPDVVPRWVAYHKLAGYLTTRSDPHGEATVYDALPADFAQLKYLGRLDKDTEGLLIFSNQGDAIHGLLHPGREVEREYRAWVSGVPSPRTLARLVEGVELDDGLARAKRATLVRRQRHRGVLEVVLTEGRKREVRRLLRAVGHRVERLKRTRFGTVLLGDLPPGEWRPLSDEEIRQLLALAGKG